MDVTKRKKTASEDLGVTENPNRRVGGNMTWSLRTRMRKPRRRFNAGIDGKAKETATIY